MKKGLLETYHNQLQEEAKREEELTSLPRGYVPKYSRGEMEKILQRKQKKWD